MNGSQFVAYVGPCDLHDGQVREVCRNQDKVIVHVESGTGRSFSVEFTGVSELKAVEPAGMSLYALCEMSAATPRRRFVFANWAEDDPAMLEIVAEGFQVVG